MEQNTSPEESTKVVQTELPASSYEQFKITAAERGMSLKEAAAEALLEFTHRYQPVDRDDPLFEPLGWDDEGPADDASERVDEIAYGSESR